MHQLQPGKQTIFPPHLIMPSFMLTGDFCADDEFFSTADTPLFITAEKVISSRRQWLCVSYNITVHIHLG